ncbi:FAR1-related protein [Sesbania bispinosa]|nr:FAR1-related protein [Sesbania bispinosa]
MNNKVDENDDNGFSGGDEERDSDHFEEQGTDCTGSGTYNCKDVRNNSEGAECSDPNGEDNGHHEEGDMGGFENVGFRKKDMYNQIEKQRRKKGSYARTTVAYLQRLRKCDEAMYWRHMVDNDDMVEIPQTLILNRWTVCAKESDDAGAVAGWDLFTVCRYDALHLSSKGLLKVACRTSKYFSEVMTMFKIENETREVNQGRSTGVVVNEDENIAENIKNPVAVRTEGCRGSSCRRNGSGRRTLHCSACGLVGHNKQTFLRRMTVDEDAMEGGEGPSIHAKMGN